MCVYVYTIKIGTCMFMYAVVLCLLMLRFVYQAYMSRVFPAAFQSCDKESRGGGRCMLFLFHFFLILFLWVFLLICSDLHLSHCDLQISIWLHCLVNTTFQGYCNQVDLHQRKEKQKLIRTAQYHCINVHEFNSNCPWNLIFLVQKVMHTNIYGNLV